MAIYKDVSSLEVVGYTEPKNGTFSDGVQFVLKKLDAIPKADVAPVIHAHWIVCGMFDDFLKCSNCGYKHPAEIVAMESWPYCPNCPAKMDEEVK